MPVESINAIISRVATDREFRLRFFSDFDRAVQGYDLTDEDRAVLRQVTPKKIESMTLTLRSWGEPEGVASLDLMRFLNGQADQRTVFRDPLKRRARFNQRLLIGVVALAIVLVLIGVLVGMNLSGGDGRPVATPPAAVSTSAAPPTRPADGSCPCACAEDCSGVTCITICTDCNGDRCVP